MNRTFKVEKIYYSIMLTIIFSVIFFLLLVTMTNSVYFLVLDFSIHGKPISALKSE